eukprot:TRINITY_DN5304_c0_g1::TRINITY_DN5304_c0_g1_i1::g.23523::m.23523 TRINITY_DN5304_c0_g1::TRINITY_DN5304_c0_g1_i1::g.23523  ORF type:complete len:292 (+),score=27.64,sp/Q9SSR0/RBL5_ARATH/33.06/2e-30,Rhomboid/PF01694.17/4.1e+03,Rhomboid/PF01694.17/4.9e-36,DUF4203/PF13886.1/1.2,DUF4203/PF13886.1/1.3 TRINITY_DN5304_c0_g1_i1:29-904(+)
MADGQYFHLDLIEVQDKNRFGSFFERQLRDTRPSDEFHRPFFTPWIYFMLVLNTSFLAYMLFDYGGIEDIHDNAAVGPDDQTLIDTGAKCVRLMREDNEWWRLFVPMFLHTGVVHFAFNSLALFAIAIPTEKEIGMLRMMAVYLVSGVFANIASSALDPRTISVGASGALLGIIGIGFSDLTLNWSLTQNPVRHLIQYILVTVMCIGFGFFRNADNYAHAGGLVAGYFVGLMVCPVYVEPPHYLYLWWQKAQIRWPFGVVCLGALYAGGILLILSQDKDWLDSEGHLKYKC